MLLLSLRGCLTSASGRVGRVPVGRAPGWRREWDSNPRYAFTHTRFPSVRLKPLGHPSGSSSGPTRAADHSKSRVGGKLYPPLVLHLFDEGRSHPRPLHAVYGRRDRGRHRDAATWRALPYVRRRLLDDPGFARWNAVRAQAARDLDQPPLGLSVASSPPAPFLETVMQGPSAPVSRPASATVGGSAMAGSSIGVAMIATTNIFEMTRDYDLVFPSAENMHTMNGCAAAPRCRRRCTPTCSWCTSSPT